MAFVKLRFIVLFSVIIGIITFINCYAQQISSGISSDFSQNEILFNYEVKVIDEFIERFNDAPNSYIREVYKDKGKQFNLTREQLLISLFNLTNKKITNDTALMSNFIKQVNNKQNPEYINFTDADWYVEASAIVTYQNKTMQLPLILHIKSKTDDWAKWMIVGIGNLTPIKDNSDIKPDKFKSTKPPTYIPTSSYATNFADLSFVFSNNVDYANYFEPQFLSTDNGQNLVKMLKKEELGFMYVKKMSFYFFQIKNWVFVVDEINRKSINSGWLINALYKFSPTEKINFKNKLLHTDDTFKKI